MLLSLESLDTVKLTRIGGTPVLELLVVTPTGEVAGTRQYHVVTRVSGTIADALECVGTFGSFDEAVAKFNALVADDEAHEEAQEDERFAMRQMKDEAEARRQEYIDYVLSRNPLHEFQD
jgi:hypothetical protein